MILPTCCRFAADEQIASPPAPFSSFSADSRQLPCRSRCAIFFLLFRRARCVRAKDPRAARAAPRTETADGAITMERRRHLVYVCAMMFLARMPLREAPRRAERPTSRVRCTRQRMAHGATAQHDFPPSFYCSAHHHASASAICAVSPSEARFDIFAARHVRRRQLIV